MNRQLRSVLNALLNLYWSVRLLGFNFMAHQSVDFGIHLLITFYDEPDPERFSEYEFCIRWNRKHPYIKKIHVFYENRKGEIPALLKHAKIQVHDCRTDHPRGIMFGSLFEFAHEYLKSEIVAIANTDIFFDRTLGMLKHQNLSNKVLALTRYNRGIYGSHYCEIWKRRPNSQDSWIFKSPLPSFNWDIFMGWKGSDNKLAYELSQAGVSVINPSQDVKTWHYHCSADRNYIQHKQSYLLDSQFKVSSMTVAITKLEPE